MLRPGGFRHQCVDQDLNCSEVVREWFKYHELLHARTLEIEMTDYYEPASIRMAIHRLYKSNELIRIGWGVYRHNKEAPPARPPIKRVSAEIIEEIRKDSTHSHNELARLLGVNAHAVRKAGHHSPFKFSGAQHAS